MHFARKFWIKGNTNWENDDVVTRFREAYQRKANLYYITYKSQTSLAS